MGPYDLHKPKTSKQVSQLSHAIWTASAMLVPFVLPKSTPAAMQRELSLPLLSSLSAT
jgi:hypothetical protein